jgi:hypothetical protein
VVQGGEEEVYYAPCKTITDWKRPAVLLVSDETSSDGVRIDFFDALLLTYLLDEYDTSTNVEIVKLEAGIAS